MSDAFKATMLFDRPPSNEEIKFLLRWRFDFANNKPSKYGQWSRPATIKNDLAAMVNKEALVRACIEGKDRKTKEITPIVECDGHDFVNFEWVNARHHLVANLGCSMLAPFHRLLGLALVTREMKALVLLDGTVLPRPRTEAEKKLHLEGFGK